MCGRLTRIIAPQNVFDTLPLPGLTYLMVIGGDADGGLRLPQRITMQITGWADGDDADATASAVLAAAQSALTPLAFSAHGLDVFPGFRQRQTIPVDGQGMRRLARADCDLEWIVTPS